MATYWSFTLNPKETIRPSPDPKIPTAPSLKNTAVVRVAIPYNNCTGFLRKRVSVDSVPNVINIMVRLFSVAILEI